MEVDVPEWARVPRLHQPEAVRACIDAFARVDLVILDAPVGSGKTWIAEMVRRELNPNRRTIYMCTDKQLQDQVERDFPYAHVLKGRANYPTEAFPEEWPAISCDDCMLVDDDSVCVYCNTNETCPYLLARSAAIGVNGVGGGPLSVINTSMYLSLRAFKPTTALTIVDECDEMEGALSKFVTWEVPKWALRACSMTVPGKGVHKQTIVGWMKDLAHELIGYAGDLDDQRRRREVSQYVQTTLWAAREIELDAAREGSDPDRGGWFREYKTDTFAMRPVQVSGFGKQLLWKYGKKWLLMSGTVVSAEELVESLGWTDAYEVVSVPSTFPVEHRPVNIAPIANMTYKTAEAETPKLIHAIRELLEIYPRERVLVHSVSYQLAKAIVDGLGGLGGLDRCVYSHQTSAEKSKEMLAWQRDPTGVMVSPSMMRGVDLAGDKCRVNVIAKCPFPSLGDKQVALRLRMHGGERWYAVRTIRNIQQMVGRSTRSENDWSHTWVLDSNFVRVYDRNKALFLESFTKSVIGGQDIRWLMPTTTNT